MDKVRKNACNGCPFEGKNPLPLMVNHYNEIVGYVIEGTNHLCHSDSSNSTICRGGRNLFLRVATMRGLIDNPTDEALETALKLHKTQKQ